MMEYTPKKRNYNEILAEASETPCLRVVNGCWQEIKGDARSYSLVQLRYALDFLKEQARRIAKKDARKLKRIINL